MATANLKEVLECCICTETLTDPRSLPCGHTICLKCLKEDSDVRTRNGRYPCPVCRQTLVVPAGGIQQIGCNVMMKNLLELLDKHQNDYPCAFCCNQEPSSVCITCEGKRLCQSCEANHRRHTSKHNIVDLEEFRQGRHDEAIRALQSSVCAQHNENYKYYCRHCKQLLCTPCTVVGPCKHHDSRCSIGEASDEAKGILLSKEEELEDDIDKLNKKQEELNQNDERSKRSQAKSRNDIERYCDELIEQVQKLKEASLQEVTGLHEETQASRDSYREDMEKKVQSLEALKERTKRLRQYGSPVETLMLDVDLLQEVANTTADDIGEVPEPFLLRAVPKFQIPVDTDKILKPLMNIEVDKCLLEIDTRFEDEEEISNIRDLSVLTNDDIVAVDTDNSKVKKYNNKGEFKGVIENDKLVTPYNSVSLPDGTVKIGEWRNRKVVTVTPDGTVKIGECVRDNIVTLTPDGEQVGSMNIGKPFLGMAITSENDTVVTCYAEPRTLELYSATGEKKWEISEDDKGDNLFKFPGCVEVNSKDKIIVTDLPLNSVFIFDINGKLITRYKGEQHKLHGPLGVCVDKDDYIYVADSGNNRIICLTPDGLFHRVVLSKEDGLKFPRALTFDNHRHLVVSCYGEEDGVHLIKVFALPPQDARD